MERKGWYLVAYDIADPKRLSKTHRIVKKRGLAAQKSVFLVYGPESEISGLLDEIEKVISSEEDDLRAYPVAGPESVWTSGPNPMKFPGYYAGEE